MATQVRKRGHGTYTMGRELLCNSSKDHPKPLLLMELVRLRLPQRNEHGLCMFVGLKEHPLFMPRWRRRAGKRDLSFCSSIQVPQHSWIHLVKMIDPNCLFKTYFFQYCNLKAILGERHTYCSGPVRGRKEALLPPTPQPPRDAAVSLPLPHPSPPSPGSAWAPFENHSLKIVLNGHLFSAYSWLLASK